MLCLRVCFRREVPGIFSLPNLLQLEMKEDAARRSWRLSSSNSPSCPLFGDPVPYFGLHDRLEAEQHGLRWALTHYLPIIYKEMTSA